MYVEDLHKLFVVRYVTFWEKVMKIKHQDFIILNQPRNSQKNIHICIRDGQVVTASVSGAVDSGLIPSRVKPMTLKLVFTVSQLDAQH